MEASAENGQVKRLDIRQKGKPLRNRFSERDKEREREREREREMARRQFLRPVLLLA
jgi:hypothetical protein